jgi:glycopeptide antibiotics resistance protein
VLFETIQGLLGTGIMDIDDLLLNSLGACIGFWMYRQFQTVSRKKTDVFLTGEKE